MRTIYIYIDESGKINKNYHDNQKDKRKNFVVISCSVFIEKYDKDYWENRIRRKLKKIKAELGVPNNKELKGFDLKNIREKFSIFSSLVEEKEIRNFCIVIDNSFVYTDIVNNSNFSSVFFRNCISWRIGDYIKKLVIEKIIDIKDELFIKVISDDDLFSKKYRKEFENQLNSISGMFLGKELIYISKDMPKTRATFIFRDSKKELLLQFTDIIANLKRSIYQLNDIEINALLKDKITCYKHPKFFSLNNL